MESNVIEARSHVGACRLLGMGRKAVHRIIEKAVGRGLDRRTEEPMRYVGIDEKGLPRS